MENVEQSAATVLLSGAYERRRGYLTAAMYTCNQVAITTVVAFWGFLIRWDQILGQHQTNWALFATQAAWAGALSSIVIGLWRIYEHQLDAAIIRLYPAIYLCERLLLPAEVCTINPPDGAATLSKSQVLAGFDFCSISNARHKESWGLAFENLAGAGAIVVFGMISVGAGWWKAGIITFQLGQPPHQIGLMLLGNIIGLVLIGQSYCRWKRKETKWPVPKLSSAPRPA